MGFAEDRQLPRLSGKEAGSHHIPGMRSSLISKNIQNAEICRLRIFETLPPALAISCDLQPKPQTGMKVIPDDMFLSVVEL